MFIIGNEQEGFHIHFNATDMEEVIELAGNARITLSDDKAQELEDRLEAARSQT